MVDKLIFLISFILPGSGHLLLKKYKTALLGLFYTAFIVVAVIVVIIPAFEMIAVYQTEGDYAFAYTIGAEEFVDHSFLILIEAVFASLLILVMAVINFAFAYVHVKFI